MTEENAKEKMSLMKKISDLRDDMMRCDWSGDKMISVGNNSYYYVSSPKMRRNFAPLLRKHGLEMSVEYSDLQQLKSLQKKDFHWCVTVHVELIDVETGESRKYSAFGESSDNSDKGIAMAQTIALRQCVLQEFLITDGFDPEDADAAESGKTFTPKSPAEMVDVKSKILNKGVPPKKTAEAKSEESKKELGYKVKQLEVEDVRKEEDPAEEAKEKVVTEESSDELNKIDDLDFLTDAIPLIHQKTIDNIVRKWTEAADKGKCSVGEYNEMSFDCTNIKTAGDASAFIKKYKKRDFE